MLYLSSGVRLLRSLTNQNLKFSSFYHNTDSDCKYYQWYYKYCHNQCCFLIKCRYDCILCLKALCSDRNLTLLFCKIVHTIQYEVCVCTTYCLVDITKPKLKNSTNAPKQNGCPAHWKY